LRILSNNHPHLVINNNLTSISLNLYNNLAYQKMVSFMIKTLPRVVETTMMRKRNPSRTRRQEGERLRSNLFKINRDVT
jgi:hypothetical protein